MTPHQSNAVGCRTTAVALAASTYWMASNQEWLPAVALLSASAFLALIGGRYQALHLAERASQAESRNAADPAELPCCSFWRHSGGVVHGPDCARPSAARREVPSPVETQAAFDEITAHYNDHTSP